MWQELLSHLNRLLDYSASYSRSSTHVLYRWLKFLKCRFLRLRSSVRPLVGNQPELRPSHKSDTKLQETTLCLDQAIEVSNIVVLLRQTLCCRCKQRSAKSELKSQTCVASMLERHYAVHLSRCSADNPARRLNSRGPRQLLALAHRMECQSTNQQDRPHVFERKV